MGGPGEAEAGDDSGAHLEALGRISESIAGYGRVTRLNPHWTAASLSPEPLVERVVPDMERDY